MSEHCQHCDGCREGFGYAGNGLVYSREALIYDGWAHHCFIDGAGYLHWDEGRCPLCATAQLERAAIVAYQLKDARSQRNQWANEATRHWLNTDEPSLKDRWRRAWDEGHDCGVECGSSEERAAIVAWLSKPGLFLSGVAEVIERGEHLRDDDE